MKFRLNSGIPVYAGVAAIAGLACFWVKGGEAFREAIIAFSRLFVLIAPEILAGVLIGGFVQQLVSREKVAELLGTRSGIGGLLFAGVAGMLTPGGPFTSFPLVYALWTAGADIGALIAYLSSWSLLGLNRLIIYELPFLGPEFSILRFVVSLPLPILAGLLARAISARTGFSIGEGPAQ